MQTQPNIVDLRDRTAIRNLFRNLIRQMLAAGYALHDIRQIVQLDDEEFGILRQGISEKV